MSIFIPFALLMSGLLLTSVSAQAAYVAGTDTDHTTNKASVQYLMGSQVGANSRATISEVTTAGWVWLDATTDVKSLLTSATVPTGTSGSQNPSATALFDNYYTYRNGIDGWGVYTNPANTAGFGGPKVNQGNPTVSGASAIDWTSGSKLPGGGGYLMKVAIYDNAGNIVPNARFRVQMLGKDDTDNKFKVLGNGTGQFAPGNAKPSFTFYDCDPSASSTCAPMPAAETAGGINPTFNATTAGAGESFAQTNSSGYSYIWSTMAGVAASNLFNFQVRVSDAPSEETNFPPDMDYQSVFPAYVTEGSGYTPTSISPTFVNQTMPWAPVKAGKLYTSQSFFQITSDCLWGSTVADSSSLTSVISPATKVAGTGNSTLTVGIKNRCGTALSGQKITIKRPDGTTATLTTNGSGVATLSVVDTGSAWTGNYETSIGDTAKEVADKSPTMTYTAPPVADASKSTVSINHSSDWADGTSQATVTVKVRDQFGNPIAAGTAVCLEKSAGLGTLGSGPWATDANGNVTTKITSPTTVGSATITAWIGACDNKGDEIGPVNIDFIPGGADPGPSDIKIDKTTNTADGSSSATVTVKIVDQFGNPVLPGTEVCIEKSAGLGTLGDGPWTTDADGNVTTTVTSPTTVGSATITAWIGPCGERGGEVGSVDIKFTAGVADAGESSIKIDKSTNTADGSSTATVTVKVVDQFGNPVAPGTEVCLEKASGPGSLGAGPWTTDADGNVTSTVTSPTTVGSATITAWIGSCADKRGEVGSVDIDFIPGAADPGPSDVSIDKSKITADGSSNSTVTVKIVDQFGNPVPAGAEVCLEKTSGPGTLGDGPWTTDANGNVTTTITSPTGTGSATITAWIGSCASKGSEVGSVDVEFIPGDADAGESSIEIDKSSNKADGSSTGTVTVKIVDQFGNPVAAGVEVCLERSAGLGTLGDGPWTTDANGNVTTTITSPTTVGSATITAWVGSCGDKRGEVGSVNIDFIPGAPHPGSSSINIDKAKNTADGSSVATVTVKIVDEFGNVVPAGTLVCLAKTAGLGTIGDGPWSTDADGNVATTVTSPNETGSATITAYLGECSGEGPEVGSVNIDFVPRAPSKDHSTMNADRTKAPADGKTSTTVSVKILDSLGNPVPAGTQICLALSAGSGTLGDGPWTTDAEGNVTTTLLAPNEAGSGTVTAYAGDCAEKGEALAFVEVAFDALPTDGLATLAETGGSMDLSGILELAAGALALGLAAIGFGAVSSRRRRKN